MRIPKGFAGVAPYLFVAGASDYIRFLQNAFGADELGRSLTPNGRIANAQIQLSGATLMISEASDAFPPSRAALYLYVDDADAATDHAVQAGAELIMAPSDMRYGDRQSGVAIRPARSGGSLSASPTNPISRLRSETTS